MNFSIDLLQIFIKVSEEKSFSIAATKLHKSQSSVSAQIGLVEEQFGFKLFERSPRPLRLTEAGTIFLTFAREMTNRTEQLKMSFAELAGGIAGDIKIGTITSIATYMLPKIAREFLEKYQNIRVIITTQSASQLCEAVRHAEVDLAIILSDKQPTGFVVKTLRSESLCFVVSPEHPLARKRLVALEQLQRTPFVMGSKDGAYTQMVERMMETQGLSGYTVAARISSFEGMKEITRAGIGMSVLPEFTVQREIRDNVLTRVAIRDIHLVARILLIERPHHLETPAFSIVKKLIMTHIQNP